MEASVQMQSSKRRNVRLSSSERRYRKLAGKLMLMAQGDEKNNNTWEKLSHTLDFSS